MSFIDTNLVFLDHKSFFKPKINNYSKKMADKKSQEPERRNKKTEDILYEDAKERNKWKSIKIANKLYDDNTPHNYMLGKSRRILYENFIKKFNETLENLDIDESSDSQLQYDQYLVVIKNLIFMDSTNESKISENEEVFEGWRAMKGDQNGFVTRGDLKAFLIKALDLKPNRSLSKNKNNSLANIQKIESLKSNEENSIHHSTIDLLKINESEVRLDPLDSLNKDTGIQDVYRSIKQSRSPNKVGVNKKVKNFFSLKLKENKLKTLKDKSKGNDPHKDSNTSKNFGF